MNHFTMRQTFIFLVLISTVIAARAGMVIQELNVVTLNKTNQSFTVTKKIQGDKIRVDMDGGPQAGTSMILDANTCDEYVLTSKHKSFGKHSGAKEKELRGKKKSQPGNSNTAAAVLIEPLDTGKSEKVGVYDTEIYTCSGVNGVTLTYWVAKDFPDYEKINSTIEKLGESAGLARINALTALPGMVVKSQSVLKLDASALTNTTTLILVKEESFDASVFEVPNDYTDTTPPARRQRTNPVAPPNN